MLSDAFPEFGLDAPQPEGQNSTSVHLHVTDADALASRAVAAGAEMLMPPTESELAATEGRM